MTTNNLEPIYTIVAALPGQSGQHIIMQPNIKTLAKDYCDHMIKIGWPFVFYQRFPTSPFHEIIAMNPPEGQTQL